MSIEAMKQALEALKGGTGNTRSWHLAMEDAIEALRTAIQQAEAKADEPVLYIHPSTFEMNNAHVGAWKPGHELPGYIPLFTHPAPGVSEGYALVPIEPTAEMLQAASKVATPGALRAAWARMLAAVAQKGGE